MSVQVSGCHITPTSLLLYLSWVDEDSFGRDRNLYFCRSDESGRSLPVLRVSLGLLLGLLGLLGLELFFLFSGLKSVCAHGVGSEIGIEVDGTCKEVRKLFGSNLGMTHGPGYPPGPVTVRVDF